MVSSHKDLIREKHENEIRNEIRIKEHTLVSLLKTCTNKKDLYKGIRLHGEIVKEKWFEKSPYIATTLVNMYAKSGMLTVAERVFNKLPVRGIVSWNSMIAGYAKCGSNESVFHTFHNMLNECVKPDLVTFLNLLHACSQTGMSDKGQTFFEAMSKDFGMLPTLKHHTCRLHLLGRAGHFDKIANLITGLPFSPDRALWHSVLGACVMWGNVNLGIRAFERARCLPIAHAGAFGVKS